MTGPHLSIDSSGLRQIQECVQLISQPQVSIHARHCWRANRLVSTFKGQPVQPCLAV